MKRMTENAISYYTVKKEDMTNFIPVDNPDALTFSYTPSNEFLEVLKEFKDVIRTDWAVIYPTVIGALKTKLSILYPENIEDLPSSDDKVGYCYDASTVLGNSIKPRFYKKGGVYYIEFMA